MNNAHIISIGSLASFSRGLTYSGSDEVDYSSNVVLRSNNIDLATNTLNFDELKYISDAINIPEDKKLQRNSIFMCMSNGSKQHLGKVAFIDRDYPYAFGGFMGLIKPKEDIIIPKLLYYYFCSSKFKGFLSSIGNGANINNIKFVDIAKDYISVPEKTTQQSIIAELDKINELIRLKKEQLKDYDNLAQSIFYEMFGDPVENEKGWEVKKLGDVCKFTQGTQVPIEEQHLSKENGLVQFLRIIDFTQGKDAPRFVKCSNDKYILHEREIAIVRYGTPGFVCYGKIGAIANNLFKITPNQKDMFEFEFLVHWLNTEAFQSAVKSKQYGAALQAIKFSTIQGINIIIPSLTVQRSFATRISQIDKQKKYIEESIKDLETLLASRMQYWFD